MDYALQVARGLAAAHDKGIIHRDLEPENLFVTNAGVVKILDFGLARQAVLGTAEDTHTPTLGRETGPGVVLGTVAYMSEDETSLIVGVLGPSRTAPASRAQAGGHGGRLGSSRRACR